MLVKRPYILAAGSLALAFGVGFAMQQGEAGPTMVAGQGPQADSRVPMARSPQLVDSRPDIPADSAAPQGAPSPGAVPLAIDPDDVLPAATLGACAVTVSADPAPMAMIDLQISAPCHAGQAMVLHHRGMMVSLRNGETGTARIALPALSAEATVIVSFDDGTGASATAALPDLADLDRAVLQWRGDAGFEMHARENGAAYGSEGDIWRENPRATAGDGGVMVMLGDDDLAQGYRAEVYTRPHGAGAVELSAEAAVTAANCARPVAAQSLQIGGEAGLRTQDLTVTMPDCDAVGDYLILQNMLLDLKIAAR